MWTRQDIFTRLTCQANGQSSGCFRTLKIYRLHVKGCHLSEKDTEQRWGFFSWSKEAPGKRTESTYIAHQSGMSGLVSFAALFLATLIGLVLFTLLPLRFLYPPNIPKMLNIAVMPVKIIKLAYLVA